MPAVSMSEEAWIALVGFLISAIGFAVHTTWQLGQIKGSLNRDLFDLRKQADDHEDRIRSLEKHRLVART